MKQESEFRKKYTFLERNKEAIRIIEKYPERIPVICEKSKYSKMKNIDKNKYLVPCDLSIGQFIFVIRKRIQLKSEESIFIFIDNKLPTTSSLIKDVYNESKNADGFLYILFTNENTFGKKL